MEDSTIIEEFKSSWRYTRDMTTQFISCVPEDKWNYSHHPTFAPLQKQFRHMTKVYGCYIDAMESKKLDMSKKKIMASATETRSDILSCLDNYDKKLDSILTKLKETGLKDFKVNVFGMIMGFTEFTHVMIQHEVGHFGLWKNYAVFGSFETPKIWQTDWKL